MSAGTVTHYLRYAQAFLAGFPGALTETLAGLSAGQVTGYVLELARRRRGRPPDMVVLPALRSLLRYLHAARHIRLPLAAAVPAGRAWRQGLPRAASPDHLRAVLASCDRDSAGGRRDYAIVLVITRLALRGGEVAGLDLADVGWRTGELAIHGKGGRMDTLPLPVDVGEAMADYLLHARPASTSPRLFVAMKAPFPGLAVSSVTQVVARACERAGVPRFGPHRIRHAAACGLLSAGASMEEIGQLLRHAQQRTTAIYARVDQAGWPSWPCPARREPRDEHGSPRRGLPGDAPVARFQAARRGPDAGRLRSPAR